MHLLEGRLTREVLLAKYFLDKKPLRSLIVGTKIKLPGGIEIFINDRATLHINIPDHYLREEYMKHPDYVPCEGWVVLDIDAYVGIYTLWAAKKVGDEGFVIAFEPNPLAFRWLTNNIELNALRNVKALPYALGDKVMKSILHVADKNIGASSLIRDHVINNPSGKYSIINEFNVQVLTLDYVIERATTIVREDRRPRRPCQDRCRRL
jgi:FkbM family methyltransferase